MVTKAAALKEVVMNKNLKIILIIVGSIIAATSIFSVLGFLFIYSAQPVEIGAIDKRILVGPNEIAPYFEGFVPNSDDIRCKKVKFIDQSTELTLSYDSEDEEHPFINVNISHELKLSDAFATYVMQWNASILGFNIGDSGIEVREDNSFVQIGDKSRFGFIEYNGRRTGNILVFMKGNNIYTFIITGFYFNSQDILSELFDTRVELLKNFN